MDLLDLRARGVSPRLRGRISNPVRRLLWPFHRPYFRALLEEIDALRRAGAASPREETVQAAATMHAETLEDMRRRYDALKKDLTAQAARLASFEERQDAAAAPREAAPHAAAVPDAEPPRPSYAQCGEDRIVDYLLRAAGAPASIRYLDIGAAFPSGDSNTFLFYRQGGSGVLVEADPAYLPAYHAIRPRDTVESVALVPEATKPADGMTDLFLAEDPGWTSILPGRAEEAAQRGKGGLRRRLRVPAATIREVMDRHFAPDELHLVSIDAEGIDDALVREIDFARHRPWILVVETMGSDDAGAFLAGQGYDTYADTHVNRIFVRRDILARAAF